MKGFLDPLRVVTTHRLRNVALVAWCFLAFCLWYFPFVCIRLGTDTGETSGTLMDIYIRHAQTGGQLVHPKCHAQDDNQQTWENLTNQVRKIAFQSIFSLISNFRHRWFFQSMVISIIDERRGGRHQKKKNKGRNPERASLLPYLYLSWDSDRSNVFIQSTCPKPFWGARGCRLPTLHQTGAQHRLWRTQGREKVCIPSNDGENNYQTQDDLDLRPLSSPWIRVRKKKSNIVSSQVSLEVRYFLLL